MALKRGVAAFVAAAALAALLTGCSTSGADQAGTPSSRGILVLVDGDSHGYITFDTDSEILRGYTHDGKKVWQENRYFPTDVHCTTACPDAAISATVDMNHSASETHVLWKHGESSTAQPFTQKSLVVQWARDKDTWVATSESAIIWSDSGETHTKSFAKGISDSMGRVSADNSALLISVQQNDGAPWNAFRFSLTGEHLSPSPISTDLPGSVGCLSPAQGTMWTLGDKASEFSLTTGKEIRGTAQFASDCASSSTSTLLGAFSADSDASVQQISITSGSRSTPFKKTTVKSAGEIGIFRDCGVLLSNGRLASLTLQGKKTETKVSAHSMLTVPNGHIYSIGPTGKVEQHTITAKGGNCRIS
ncbi:hypothetical protein [Streptomyces sp. NBC_00078]|uniref:hypothetical protein n=1 Tax=unclassified Streptomyces TaxID=2593676 RepID=UPI00225B62D4|nr:hypothetical protein [Streptomyces sp. NBC_00078]MCX5424529.1 hypothetical protein [Streptomyces sp. NBC_00078]